MSIYSKLFIITAIFVFIGCGGSNSTDSTNTSQITTVDVSNLQKIEITKDNAVDLLSTIKNAIPESIVGKDEVLEIINSRVNTTTECNTNGTVVIETTSKTQVSFTFNQCQLDPDTKIDGTISYIIEDKTVYQGITDYMIGKNLRMSYKNQNVVYDFKVKSYRLDTDSSQTKKITYYAYFKDLNNNKSLEYNFYVNSKDSVEVIEYVHEGFQDVFIEETHEREISGTYIVDEENYFTLETKRYSNEFDLSWFGVTGENTIFDQFMENNGIAVLFGNNSSFEFQNISGIEFYKIEENNEQFYKPKGEDIWYTTWTEIFANNYDPEISLSSPQKKAIYGDASLFYDQNITLTIRVSDADEYKDLEGYIEILKKPKNSQLILDNDLGLNYSTYIEKNINLFLDEEGTYTFKITIIDEDRRVEKTVSLEYYDPSLSSNQFLFSNNVVDSLWVPAYHCMAILSSDKLTLIDEVGKVLSSLELYDASSLSLGSEDGQIVVSSGSELIIIDISNVYTPQINKTYTFPTLLGDIEVFGNYIYALEKRYDWLKLYSLNTSNGEYSTLDYASYGKNAVMRLNPVHQTLYVTDSGLSPSGITKHDISLGSAVKLYDGPYSEFCTTIWLLNESDLLTSCAEVVSMSLVKSTDMELKETLDSDNIFYNEYSNTESEVLSVDTYMQTNKTLLGIGRPLYRDDSISYDPYENSIEIRSNINMELQNSDILQKYYIDESDEEYKLFIQNTQFISDDKIFVIYKGYPTERSIFDEREIIIYEVKQI